jgi:capsular polysaccharide biosynthesis protein
MVAVGWILFRINAVYVRVSHEPAGPRQTPWLRSQASDRSSSEPRRAIDVIMACSVGLAMAVMAVWFFFYAGSPLPGGA